MPDYPYMNDREKEMKFRENYTKDLKKSSSQTPPTNSEQTTPNTKQELREKLWNMQVGTFDKNEDDGKLHRYLDTNTQNRIEQLLTDTVREEVNKVLDGLVASVHYRVGPGKCYCGFNAYAIDGIMLDYGELLHNHLINKKHDATSFESAIEQVRKDLNGHTN